MRGTPSSTGTRISGADRVKEGGSRPRRSTCDYLVEATEHALREVWLGDEAAYRISDFPLTDEALRTSEPRAESFLDPVDPAEALILRELEMNAMLMLPLRVRGTPWEPHRALRDAAAPLTEDDISVAEFLTMHQSVGSRRSRRETCRGSGLRSTDCCRRARAEPPARGRRIGGRLAAAASARFVQPRIPRRRARAFRRDRALVPRRRRSGTPVPART
jgi:hypothetical protein